jgi:hypothetical protein
MSFNLEDKIKILEYADRYGIPTTIDAVGINGKKISNKTIYRWRSRRNRLVENNKPIRLLAPKSRKPINHRQPEYDIRVSEYILWHRKTYPVMGKTKLKVFVDRYCKLNNIQTVSESTIGNILCSLREHNLLVEYCGTKQTYLRGDTGAIKTRLIKRIKKLRKPYGVKAKSVGDIIQLDAVTVQVQGKKQYFINCIDLSSRKAFSLPCSTLNSKNAMLCIQKFENILQTKIIKVQTDNGLENHKHFDNYLKEQGILHYWNKPRSPKENAFIERFNRTIQEECINKHLHLCKSSLREDLEEVISDYLFFYNNIRIHSSLQYLTPNEKYNQLIHFLKCM